MTDNKHIIWSDYNLDFEDWREDLAEQYPGLPESELIDIMYKTNADYLAGKLRVEILRTVCIPIVIMPHGLLTASAIFAATRFTTTQPTIIFTECIKTAQLNHRLIL